MANANDTVNRPRFSDLLAMHISNTIKKRFMNEQLNENTIKSIRNCIQDVVHGIFRKSTYNLSDDALNWISNQYLKSVNLNGSSINDLVLINDYDLSDMTHYDITLMRKLFNETNMSEQLDKEYLRRFSS